MRTRIASALTALAGFRTRRAGTASAQRSERFQAMNRPVEPFRVIGNLYSVGASGVTSCLLTSPAGHVLIDGGFAETAPVDPGVVQEAR